MAEELSKEQTLSERAKTITMSTAAFLSLVVMSIVGAITILGLFANIDSKLSTIKNQHELRINLMEEEVKVLKLNDTKQKDDIQNLENKAQNHIDNKYIHKK